MIKNVSVNELVFSDLLRGDVIDSVNNEMNSFRGKFILTGSRGCGKSTVLVDREARSIGTDHPAFFTRFDGAGLFGTKDNDYYNKKVIEHYYEIVMTRKFLGYVKKYYPEVYESKLGDIAARIDRKTDELDNYINNAIYKNCSIDHKFFSGEALSEAISLFRNSVGAKSFTLMVDRFDWTHNSDPRVQEILKHYFSMFEKVIITSDDTTLSCRNRRRDFIDRGYSFVDMSYGNDVDVVKDIVEKRFEYDDITSPVFPIEDVNEEDYLRVMDRAQGNIDTVLDTFHYAEVLHRWDNRKPISEILDAASREKQKEVKQLRKVSRSPRLY